MYFTASHIDIAGHVGRVQNVKNSIKKKNPGNDVINFMDEDRYNSWVKVGCKHGCHVFYQTWSSRSLGNKKKIHG